MPPAFDLTRFLSSSIVFMTHLSEVSVYFDNKRLTRLTKMSGAPREIGIPKGLQALSPGRLMTVKGVKLTGNCPCFSRVRILNVRMMSADVQIQAEVLQWVYSTWKEKPHLAMEPTTSKTKASALLSSLFSVLSKRSVTEQPPQQLQPEVRDPLSVNISTIVLSIFSANVDARLDQKLAKALHRSTFKDPPNKLRYELIYVNHGFTFSILISHVWIQTSNDEYEKATKEDEKYASKTMSIFHGLRADLEG
jgi:hypothetical protein